MSSNPSVATAHRDYLTREAQAVYTTDGSAQPVAPVDGALTRLIGVGASREVLAVFLLNPDARVHQREISRRAHVGLRSARLALERLERLGLIVSVRDGNRKYYSASRAQRFEELRVLLSREFGLGAAVA